MLKSKGPNLITDLDPALLVSYIGRRLFSRKLTDFSGGNVSIRVGDEI